MTNFGAAASSQSLSHKTVLHVTAYQLSGFHCMRLYRVVSQGVAPEAHQVAMKSLPYGHNPGHMWTCTKFISQNCTAWLPGELCGSDYSMEPVVIWYGTLWMVRQSVPHETF